MSINYVLKVHEYDDTTFLEFSTREEAEAVLMKKLHGVTFTNPKLRGYIIHSSPEKTLDEFKRVWSITSEFSRWWDYEITERLK